MSCRPHRRAICFKCHRNLWTPQSLLCPHPLLSCPLVTVCDLPSFGPPCLLPLLPLVLKRGRQRGYGNRRAYFPYPHPGSPPPPLLFVRKQGRRKDLFPPGRASHDLVCTIDGAGAVSPSRFLNHDTIHCLCLIRTPGEGEREGVHAPLISVLLPLQHRPRLCALLC